MAVGGDVGQSTVWSLDVTGRWSVSAGPEQFPASTLLRGVASIGSTLVAVGSTTVHTQTLRFVDESLVSRTAEFHSTEPRIFASLDGETWEVIGDTGMGVANGSLRAVTGSGTQLVAVGWEYPEPDLEEPHGLIAVTSLDGTNWSPAQLVGVASPAHGDVSALASVGSEVLVATSGFTTTKLYAGSLELGFSEIPLPVADGTVSYVAGAGLKSGYLLAGVDDQDETHFWAGDGTWEEIAPPAPLDPSSRPLDFEVVDGELISVGVNQGRGFVEGIAVP